MALFKDQRVTVIDEKLKYFEALSRDMSEQVKRGLEKLYSVNDSIVLLLNKTDTRIVLLENRDNNHDKTLEGIKDILKANEQNIIAHRIKTDEDFDKLKQKIAEMDRLMYTTIIFVTGTIAIAGILASAGWLSPERFNSSGKKVSLDSTLPRISSILPVGSERYRDILEPKI